MAIIPMIAALFWGGLLFYSIRKNLSSDHRRSAVTSLLEQKADKPWLPAALIVGGALLTVAGSMRIHAAMEAFEPIGGPWMAVAIMGGLLAGTGAAVMGAE